MTVENTFKKLELISELKEIQKQLSEIYIKTFKFKYKFDNEFKSFIDLEHKENGVASKDKDLWNDNYCYRASYTLLNKILFVRICEDKGFMLNSQDYISGQAKDSHIGEKLSKIGLQKWNSLVTNYTLGELVEFAFKDMKASYSNIVLYKKDKYEMLNPSDEEFSLKYIDRDEDTKEIVMEFENVLNNILEKLDTNEFNFKCIDGSILGDVYENLMDIETRKAIGQFYTPKFVIEYILKNTAEQSNVLENPFVKIVDISCGSGHFLIMAYDILKEKFLNNIEELREKYSDEIYTIKKNEKEIEIIGKDYWIKDNIHYHILKHCIYGADMDSFAVQLTTINLILKDLDNFTDELNIVECDSLVKWEEDYDWKDIEEQLEKEFEAVVTTQVNLFGEEEEFQKTIKKENYKLNYKDLSGIKKEEIIDKQKAEEILELCKFWNNKFEYIVGNPPYVGHKQLSIAYKEWLLDNYSDVFKDKADLSFCFFDRINKKLDKKGKGAIITSRYFMESPTGKSLRLYLQNQSNIKQIVDFYGAEIFKGVGVATSIYMFENHTDKENDILVHKLLDDTYTFEDDCKLEEIVETELFENFRINQQMLEEERWILIPKDQYEIYKKITSSASYKLEDVAESFQGIITGCDKAFVMTEEETISHKIEKGLLKKWIKNSNVRKYTVSQSDLMLIYSDSIEDESMYPNSLGIIEEYRDRLENRRECKNGVRKWYQLQWGRDSSLFEQTKIVFPYKSKSNKFALDLNDSYCSADVYSFILKSEFKDKVSLEYLLGILNSKIYEFYFKLFAKKMGQGIYDYYPNSIMDLKVTLDFKIVEKIEQKVKEIIRSYSLMKDINVSKLLVEEDLVEEFFKIKLNNINLEKNIYYLEIEIEELLGEFFNLNDKDFETISRVLKLKNLESVEELLNERKFYDEYIIEKLSVKQIAEKYKIEEFLVEMIWCRYITKHIDTNSNEKKIDIELLFPDLDLYLKKRSEELLSKYKKYINLYNLQVMLEEEVPGFRRIIDIYRTYDINIKTTDIIRDAIKKDTYTWNAYKKDKNQDKIKKTFIKYDSEFYGLSEWSDEIHKKYFTSAIEQYTTSNPNYKKAEEILKVFNQLDIDDKKDYVDILEDKIKVAFN